MPAVDFSITNSIQKHAMDILFSEEVSGKYITIRVFSDMMISKFGIVGIDMNKLLRISLEKTCPHTLAISRGVNNLKKINETCNMMVPSGIVGIISGWGHSQQFYFSDVSDMIAFRLLLPPMDIS